MMRLVIGLAVLTPALALAQGDSTSKAEKKLGKILDKQANKEDSAIDDDDLLDADLDDEAIAPVPKAEVKTGPVVAPSGATKTRVDREASRIGARANAVGKELFEELTTKLKNGPKNAKVEIERRSRKCDERITALSRQLERIASKLDENSLPPTSEGDPYGYGTQVVSFGRTPSGVRLRASASGQAQYQWWQKLLVKSIEGVDPGLSGLVGRRLNELKLDGDSLSLTVEPQFRPYADMAIRKAIESSALGRGVTRTHIDRRLNDLFTFGKRKAREKVAVPEPRRRVRKEVDSEKELTRFMGLSIQRFMLPRVKDPNTGRIRVFVNHRLGEGPRK